MEHEDVIKIPVHLKELQAKIKHAQTKLVQVLQCHNFDTECYCYVDNQDHMASKQTVSALSHRCLSSRFATHAL